jgi:glycosyltransferase involved in cell wall biosynthesis
MKILHTVEFYHPLVGGMQEVVKQLSERLVGMGHDVTIATTKLFDRKEDNINGVNIVEFNISGNAVWGLKGEVERYERFLKESNFDIVANFAAQQWATDVALPILSKIKAKKVFVPTGFSGLYVPEYKEYFEKMKGWMKEYDMNVFLSDDYRDVNFAKENGVKKRILIPNGAGEDEFLEDLVIDIRAELEIPRNDFLILHVGSHTGVKGHEETIEIFKKTRMRNATLLIVGNKMSEGGCYETCRNKGKLFNKSLFRFLDGKKIIIAELSRMNTVAAYKAADLFLFPSNIECSPIVLFECMASKTPFLTADVGNSREITTWSQSGVVLPTRKDNSGFGLSHVDVDAGAKILESIAKNKIRRNNMQENGFTVWKEKYSWEKIAKEYENLYTGLISKK